MAVRTESGAYVQTHKQLHGNCRQGASCNNHHTTHSGMPKRVRAHEKMCTKEPDTILEQSPTLLPATISRPMNPAPDVDF